MHVRHFIDTQDFEKVELLRIIELTARLKEADKAGACPTLLEGASLGMLFEEPSTRTRVSFEVANSRGKRLEDIHVTFVGGYPAAWQWRAPS